MSEKKEKVKRRLIISVEECIDSNPNGDPSRNGEPRIDPSGIGLISAVARRKKFRLLVEDKEGEIWKRVEKVYNLNADNFSIAASPKTDQASITKLSKENSEQFFKQFWDARLYGCTQLYEKIQGIVTTGVVHTQMGRSVVPIPSVLYGSVTVSKGVKEGQDRTIANDAIKVVPYAIYKTLEFVDASKSHMTHCTEKDIEVYLAILPYIWTETKSQSRSQVRPIHIHCLTYNNPLDQRFDYEIEKALTPTLKDGKTGLCRDDFVIPTWDLIKDKYSDYVTYEDLAQKIL